MTRPQVTNAPASAGYGVAITIDTPQAALVNEVVLMRSGAVTHGFNMSQRLVECVITGNTATTVDIDTPPNPFICPPGWYLLFVLTAGRTPSEEGWWIRITP